jgi:multiple sugar transport system substrate-binding protein
MKKVIFAMLMLLGIMTLAACAEQRDQVPTFSGVDLTPEISVGESFTPLSGVTASDKEDGDLTSSIVVSGWNPDDVNYVGTTTYILSVTDSTGQRSSLTVKLTVTGDAQPPLLTGVVAEQQYSIGSSPYNPLARVTANDPVDGDLTDEVEVVGDYAYNEAGRYVFAIIVTNSAGARAKATVVLNVIDANIPAEMTNTPITITLWHAMGEANQALLQKYADSFNEIYPNITVEIPAGAGNYDTLKNNMINAITAKDMPNLVQAYPDHVAEYLNGNAVVNLDPYINSNTWGLNGADDFEDIILSYREENSQYDAYGTFYSLPFNKSTEIMIYNKTAFDFLELPTPETWQDIIAAAPVLKAYGDQLAEAKVRTDNPGLSEVELAERIGSAQNMIVPASYDSTGNAFITFTRQWGGAYTGINYSDFTGQYLWRDNANTMLAMTFLKDNGNIITLPEYWDQEYASKPFVNQQTFVTIGSSAGIRYNIPATDPTTGDPVFEIGVAPVPFNGDLPDEKAVIQQGTNVSVLNTGSDMEKLASWLFLKHIISTENTIDWAMSTGYLPVRTSGNLHPAYQEFLNNPTANQLPISMAANAAYAQSGYMFYDPAFIGSSRARVQVGLALERIMLGDGDIQAALQSAYDEANLGS